MRNIKKSIKSHERGIFFHLSSVQLAMNNLPNKSDRLEITMIKVNRKAMRTIIKTIIIL